MVFFTLRAINVTAILAFTFLVWFEMHKYFTIWNIFLVMAFWLYESALMTHMFAVCISVFMVGFGNYRITNLCFQQMNASVQQDFSTSLMIYKKIELINNLYNCSLGKMVVPLIKTGTEIIVPTFTYMTIRLSYTLLENPLMLFLPFTSFACLIYHSGFLYLLSEVYKHSVLFLLKFDPAHCACESKNEKMLLAKYRRSLKPMKVKVSYLYFIDRLLILNALSFIVDLLMFLLLNF